MALLGVHASLGMSSHNTAHLLALSAQCAVRARTTVKGVTVVNVVAMTDVTVVKTVSVVDDPKTTVINVMLALHQITKLRSSAKQVLSKR